MKKNNTICKALLAASLLTLSAAAKAQTGAVGIGTITPDASAQLDVTSATKGFLGPRVALTASNAAAPLTNPATGLMVFNTTNAGSGTTAVIANNYYYNAGTPAAPNWVRFTGTPADGTGTDWHTTGNAGTTAGTNFIGTTDAQDLATKTNGTEKMRVTSAGLVGIGTSTPASRLDITDDGGGGTSTDDVTINAYGASTGPAYRMTSAKGSAASPANLVGGETVGALNALGRVNGAYTGLSSISMSYLGNGTTALSDIRFNASGVERMRIDQAGHLLLGTTTPFGAITAATSSGVGFYLQSTVNDLDGLIYLDKINPVLPGNIDQFIIFKANNTELGTITASSANSIAFNTTSDIRLKENIRPTHYGLADVLNIQVRDYNYKTDKNVPQTGFIAQQLYTIFPMAVTKGGDDVSKPWMVDYSKLTPLLAKAIQDLDAKVEALEQEKKQLTATVAELQSKEATYAELAARIQLLEQAAGISLTSKQAVTANK